MSDTSGYAGVGFSPSVWAGPFNRLIFTIQSLINGLATATLVQVKAVTNTGDDSPVGTVDVQPMVNQVDGQGQAKAHGTIYKLPYFRLQGGTNAVILDPKVDDIGIAIFCHTDISTVKSAKKVSNPGSFRRFNWADGLYVGGFLNAKPENYVQFDNDGNITVRSTGTVNINCDTINMHGSDGTGSTTVTVKGTLSATVDVVANSVSLHDHTHSGVTTGTGTTGPPVP